MAEDTEIGEDEAAELERLLGEAETEKEAKKSTLKKFFDKLLSDKKFLMIVGGSLLLLLMAIGAGAYFFLSESKIEEIEEIEEVEPEVEEVIEENFAKVYIYKLEPFFLPFLVEGEETGRFLTLTPNLLLSNAALDKEIDKVRQLIRKNIFRILKRKTLTDFTSDKLKAEERLKREILVTANALLLSGTGTITDVFFTELIIK